MGRTESLIDFSIPPQLPFRDPLNPNMDSLPNDSYGVTNEGLIPNTTPSPPLLNRPAKSTSQEGSLQFTRNHSTMNNNTSSSTVGDFIFKPSAAMGKPLVSTKN